MAPLVPAAVLAAALLVACYPKAGTPPGPVAPTAVAPGTNAEALTRGRNFFLAKCNGCHEYPDVAAYNEEQWKKIMPRMGDKAEMKPAESEDALAFVLASKPH